MLDRAAKSVFNSRIIALDEVVVDEADRQGRFAWASINQTSANRFGERAQKKNNLEKKNSPTDRLPTMAILRCLGGAGMVDDYDILKIKRYGTASRYGARQSEGSRRLGSQNPAAGKSVN